MPQSKGSTDRVRYAEEKLESDYKKYGESIPESKLRKKEICKGEKCTKVLIGDEIGGRTGLCFACKDDAKRARNVKNVEKCRAKAKVKAKRERTLEKLRFATGLNFTNP